MLEPHFIDEAIEMGADKQLSSGNTTGKGQSRSTFRSFGYSFRTCVCYVVG